MDVLLRKSIYVIVANASSALIRSAENKRFTTTSPISSEILPIKNDEYSRFHYRAVQSIPTKSLTTNQHLNVSNKRRDTKRSNKQTTTAETMTGATR